MLSLTQHWYKDKVLTKPIAIFDEKINIASKAQKQEELRDNYITEMKSPSVENVEIRNNELKIMSVYFINWKKFAFEERLVAVF